MTFSTLVTLKGADSRSLALLEWYPYVSLSFDLLERRNSAY